MHDLLCLAWHFMVQGHLMRKIMQLVFGCLDLLLLLPPDSHWLVLLHCLQLYMLALVLLVDCTDKYHTPESLQPLSSHLQRTAMQSLADCQSDIYSVAFQRSREPMLEQHATGRYLVD